MIGFLSSDDARVFIEGFGLLSLIVGGYYARDVRKQTKPNGGKSLADALTRVENMVTDVQATQRSQHSENVNRFNGLDARISGVDSRVSGVDRRVGAVERELSRVREDIGEIRSEDG